MIRLSAIVAFLLGSSGLACAQSIPNLCASAKQQVSQDPLLAQEVHIALPNADYLGEDIDCIYPHKLLRYPDADVVITSGTAPGANCHACPASLSAYVFTRSLKLTARFIDFGTDGSFGNPGTIDTAQILGHDSIVVQPAYGAQGYSMIHLDFYLFKSGGLHHLEPMLPLSADDSSAVPDPKDALSVAGAWFISPTRPNVVTIRYTISKNGEIRNAVAAWRIEGDRLVPQDGSVPPEYNEAAGE